MLQIGGELRHEKALALASQLYHAVKVAAMLRVPERNECHPADRFSATGLCITAEAYFSLRTDAQVEVVFRQDVVAGIETLFEAGR